GGPSTRFTSPPSWSVMISTGRSCGGRAFWNAWSSARSWSREEMLRPYRITPAASRLWMRSRISCGALVPSKPNTIRWPASWASEGRLPPFASPGEPRATTTIAAAATAATSDLVSALRIRRRVRRPRAAGLGLLVIPELDAQHAADLADRAALGERRAHRHQQVALPAGHLTELVEPLGHCVVVAVLLERLQPLNLLALRLRIHAQRLDRLNVLGHVLVHADHDVLLDSVALLVAPGRLLHLGADERDRLHRAPELLDLVDQLLCALLDLVGERLDHVRAGERVDCVGRARLVGQDLLGAKSDPGGALRGQRERLVEAVRVERLGTAAHRREALQRHAHDVVLGLLGRERHAAGLGVEPDRQGPLVLGGEALAHDPRPHPPHGAELGHLLEDVVVAVEEERQPRPELVHLQAR